MVLEGTELLHLEHAGHARLHLQVREIRLVETRNCAHPFYPLCNVNPRNLCYPRGVVPGGYTGGLFRGCVCGLVNRAGGSGGGGGEKLRGFCLGIQDGVRSGARGQPRTGPFQVMDARGVRCQGLLGLVSCMGWGGGSVYALGVCGVDPLMCSVRVLHTGAISAGEACVHREVWNVGEWGCGGLILTCSAVMFGKLVVSSCTTCSRTKAALLG